MTGRVFDEAAWEIAVRGSVNRWRTRREDLSVCS